VGDGTIFAAAEDYTDRYGNVPMSGLNYQCFAKQRFVIPPFQLNTRVYSCILLQTRSRISWRGRYNEDTDLSLHLLKDGFCAILFNAFLAAKMPTMTMKGGNADALYNKPDARLEMAKSLQRHHPDVCRISWKWGRFQRRTSS